MDPAVPASSSERRAGLLRPVVGVALFAPVPLLILGLHLDGVVAMLATGSGWLLLTVLVVFGFVNLSGDHRWLQRYPHLAHQQAWVRHGATPEQLRILDEAHRLDRLNPPVGYGDRRTLINPLADAYAIFTSPAWRDPWLADRELRLDPITEAAEIVGYVHQVTSMLAEVLEQIRVSLPGSAAQRTYLGYEVALRKSLDDGLKRARALTAYRAELRRLEVVLDAPAALPAAEAMADRVLDVLAESARQELATRELEEGQGQLRQLETELREITEFLHTTDARLG